MVILQALYHAGNTPVGAVQSDPQIVDLSKDLLPAENYNNNNGSSFLLNITKSKYPQVLSYVVLENSLKVAEYYNSEQRINKTTLHHAYSVTKSWASLLIGILVSMGKVSLSDKLQDIWPSNSTDVWADVRYASYLKNVTVEELLTMTSGCRDPPDALADGLNKIKNGTFGGSNLTSVLNFPTCSNPNPKKGFNYMNDNILSYIIYQRSG